MTDDVVRATREGPIAVIMIDRPPVNALASDAWERLDELIGSSADDDSVRAIVLAGGSGRFCAGADIRTLTDPPPDADRAAMLSVVARVAATIRASRPPVLAAIDGPAHGGGLELALACDLRIASPSATFAAAGVNMGLVASVASLVEAIGDTRARRMLLTAERIDVERALQWGLVTDVVDDPWATALELAERIAAKPPLAVEATKRALGRTELGRSEHGALMAELFRDLADSNDHREAITAFLEKRPGGFTRS